MRLICLLLWFNLILEPCLRPTTLWSHFASRKTNFLTTFSCMKKPHQFHYAVLIKIYISSTFLLLSVMQGLFLIYMLHFLKIWGAKHISWGVFQTHLSKQHCTKFKYRLLQVANFSWCFLKDKHPREAKYKLCVWVTSKLVHSKFKKDLIHLFQNSQKHFHLCASKQLKFAQKYLFFKAKILLHKKQQYFKNIKCYIDFFKICNSKSKSNQYFTP